MSWRDQLRSGSFRGAAFYIDTSSTEVGRRTAAVEFPFRSVPMVEDLGKRAPRFDVDLLVVGPTYMDARDKLREALETPGAGKLVHPFLGELVVALDGPVRIRESTAKGGIAKFSCKFIEIGNEPTPRVITDSGAAVRNAANLQAIGKPGAPTAISYGGTVPDSISTFSGVAPSAVADFRDRLAVKGEIAEVVTDVEKAISAAADKIASWEGAEAAILGVLDDLELSVGDFLGNLLSLIEDPYQLALGIWGLFTAAGDALKTSAAAEATRKSDAASQDSAQASGSSSTTRSSSSALVSAASSSFSPPVLPSGSAASAQDKKIIQSALALLATFAPAPPVALASTASATAVTQASNDQLIADACAIGALCAVSDALPDLVFESVDQAEGFRDNVVSVAETLEGSVASDNLFQALLDLKAAIIAHIESAAGTLPSLSSFRPAKTLPALAIAYELYGDAFRDEEICRRNDVGHPCFVPGGVALEVLSA